MIRRILKLARDNERVVIVDPETERAFIVLPLSVYEQLVDESAFDEDEFNAVDDDWAVPVEEEVGESGADELAGPMAMGSFDSVRHTSDLAQDDGLSRRLTDQSLIDSIDRDIAAWKAAQEQSAMAPEPTVANLDELTLTPVPGPEAPMTPPASAEEEKFYIEPVA